jgi:hypothetical protein
MTRRIVVPVQTGNPGKEGHGSGHVVYESDGTLVGFICDDVMRTRLDKIIGDHVLLRTLTINVTQYRQCCLMPGVGYVER